MSRVSNYSLIRLSRMIKEAEAAGNKIEAHALGLLHKGIEDGIWSVFWRDGAPIFTMAGEDLSETKRLYREKDE